MSPLLQQICTHHVSLQVHQGSINNNQFDLSELLNPHLPEHNHTRSIHYHLILSQVHKGDVVMSLFGPNYMIHQRGDSLDRYLSGQWDSDALQLDVESSEQDPDSKEAALDAGKIPLPAAHSIEKNAYRYQAGSYQGVGGGRLGARRGGGKQEGASAGKTHARGTHAVMQSP